MFVDRHAAGRLLAQQLGQYAGRDDVEVLGLPRGGVPVAYEVALALGAPLDILVVRKLGVPGSEELAFGAIASGGVRVLNADVISGARISPARVERIAAAEQLELERRERVYRGELPPLALGGRTVLLVDDGLATGATMRAAIQAVGRLDGHPVVAIPVAPRETCSLLRREAREVICLMTPRPFIAVGVWYGDFTATTDEEVRSDLQRARERVPPAETAAPRAGAGTRDGVDQSI